MGGTAGKYDGILDALRSGDARELEAACDEATRAWRDIPVEPLLSLKLQFMRMGLEHREAHLDEALISIAEKNAGPFTAIARDPEHALWPAAVDVLSMTGEPGCLEILLGLLPVCPRKGVRDLIRALGRYRDRRVFGALAPYLADAEEGVFIEAVMALRRSGDEEALAYLLKGLEFLPEDSGTAAVLKNVIREMEREFRL